MYLCVAKVHTDDVPVRGFLGIAGGEWSGLDQRIHPRNPAGSHCRPGVAPLTMHFAVPCLVSQAAAAQHLPCMGKKCAIQ